MRPKRDKAVKIHKLKVPFDANFWLVLATDKANLHRYVAKVVGVETPVDVGAGACLCSKEERDIIVVLAMDYTSEYIIGHEAFHAATWFAKITRRRFNKRVWMRILNGWNDFVLAEEDLADVCGCVISAIWDTVRSKYEPKLLK